MATPAYAEASSQFGAYALEYVATKVARMETPRLERYKLMLRTIDVYLAQVVVPADDAQFAELMEQVRALRQVLARELASMGIDSTWGQTDSGAPSVLVLTPQDSTVLGEALLNPPEPTESLKDAFARYKTLAGL